MKQLFYKVKIGFDKDEFISIEKDELQKAVRAQIEGGIVVFKGGSVSGNNIISITPDWNRVMGYHSDYKLTGEDYDRIGMDTSEEAMVAIQEAKQNIMIGREGRLSIEEKKDDGREN